MAIIVKTMKDKYETVLDVKYVVSISKSDVRYDTKDYHIAVLTNLHGKAGEFTLYYHDQNVRDEDYDAVRGGMGVS